MPLQPIPEADTLLPPPTPPPSTAPHSGMRMSVMPSHRFNVNASSVPSTFIRRMFFIGVVTVLCIMGLYLFKIYHPKGHHLRLKHHPGHHKAGGAAHGGLTKEDDKIRQAINANLDHIKSRAGNIYVDSEAESLKNHHNDHHDDDHEDDDYDDDDDDDEDDDDDDEDDDDDDHEYDREMLR